MKLFDFIVSGEDLDNNNCEIRDYVYGMVWCEMECREQSKPLHSRYIDTIDGISIWYDYGADYFFFEDLEE